MTDKTLIVTFQSSLCGIAPEPINLDFDFFSLKEEHKLEDEHKSKLEKWLSIFAIIFSVISLYWSWNAESRSDRLYQAKRMSDIQVTPISFITFRRSASNNEEMARLNLSITNYTGFRASNIRVDGNFYGSWIHEWIKVASVGLKKMKDNGEKLSKDLEAQFEQYSINSKSPGFDMEPGDVKYVKLTGAFRYQHDKDNILKIRVSWESENKAPFDKFFNFRLELTEAYGAQSLIAIPIND